MKMETVKKIIRQIVEWLELSEEQQRLLYSQLLDEHIETAMATK
jgi:hypothetical protein